MRGSGKNNGDYGKTLGFLKLILNAIKQERVSKAGKVNLYADLILLAFFSLILIATSLDSLYMTIYNVFAMFLDKPVNQLNSNIMWVCFFVFVFFVAMCLVYMHFTSKNEKQLENDTEDEE